MEADLVIVGGGPAGTQVLRALTRWDAPSRIVVIERGETPGPGLPYGEAADPGHTLGRVPWRRRDKGKSLRAEFARALCELKGRGVEVLVLSGTEARALSYASGSFCVETDGVGVTAERVVLATGPWHTRRLAALERAVDWRWDVRRLHAAIRDDEDVLVLGTSQSAVDIALALAARRKRAGASRVGRITLASRRGLLPSVWGLLRASRNPPGGSLQLEALMDHPAVRLGEVLEAIRRDIQRLGGGPCEELDREPFARNPSDGAAVLRGDLARALCSHRDAHEIPWQAVLWPTVPAVFDIFPRLVAEDRLALAPRWYGFLRYLEAIHEASAREILALCDEGMLKILALGEGVSVHEDECGVCATGPLAEARAHRVVDARGHDPNIPSSDDVFLRSVLGSGHAASGRVPFLNTPGALEPGSEVACHAGRMHLVTGGLWVDPTTFRVRNHRGETSSLYALGPLTIGQFPVYLGLWALRRAATRIAQQL